MEEIMPLLEALRAARAKYPEILGFTFDGEFLKQTSEHLSLKMRSDEALFALSERINAKPHIVVYKPDDTPSPRWW